MEPKHLHAEHGFEGERLLELLGDFCLSSSPAFDLKAPVKGEDGHYRAEQGHGCVMGWDWCADQEDALESETSPETESIWLILFSSLDQHPYICISASPGLLRREKANGNDPRFYFDRC